MAEDSETTKGPESQDDDKFISEFKSMSQQAQMRTYEKNNRDRIAEASFRVRDAFDQRWKKVIGVNYYQPMTTVTPATVPIERKRFHPKGKNYRELVTFSRVIWQMIRRRISKKDVALYILQGETAGNGMVRPIFQNLDANRLKAVLGAEAAGKILDASQDEESADGELKGTFELEVEGFWEVQFAPMGDQNDSVDVRLMWEGQCLIMKRMVPVVLPGYYLEVADNAMRDKYIQNEKVGRKKIGQVQQYPYTVLDTATMEQYLKQKAEGDKIMRDIRDREDG